MLKVMSFSVLIEILFNIFTNELANAIEDASLEFSTMLRGHYKHFEGHD